MHYGPLVAKLAMAADLREEDVQGLSALCRNERTIGAKKHILSQGDRPEHVHVILEGWAARYRTLSDGSRQIVAFLIPGDFCDLHYGVLGHADHGIAALTRCRVAYVPSADLDAVISAHSKLTKALQWAALVDEATLREWIVNLGRRDAFERIAHLLGELHARMKMVGLVRDDQMPFPITQNELADATGLTAVHVNRTLQRLREEKLIKLANRNLTILDLGALQTAAGFSGDYLHLRRRGPVAGH